MDMWVSGGNFDDDLGDFFIFIFKILLSMLAPKLNLSNPLSPQPSTNGEITSVCMNG